MRRKVVLAAMVLEEDQTGAYLASKLTEAKRTWNLDTKIHMGIMGIRDNATNMVSAMRIAHVDDFGCMAHTLQLVLHNALFCQTTIVKKSRKIVTHFKHSEQACRHLSACRQSCDDQNTI